MKLDLDPGCRFDWPIVNVCGPVAPRTERPRNRGQKGNRAVERLDSGDAALLVDQGLHGNRTEAWRARGLRVYVCRELTDFHFLAATPKS